MDPKQYDPAARLSSWYPLPSSPHNNNPTENSNLVVASSDLVFLLKTPTSSSYGAVAMEESSMSTRSTTVGNSSSNSSVAENDMTSSNTLPCSGEPQVVGRSDSMSLEITEEGSMQNCNGAGDEETTSILPKLKVLPLAMILFYSVSGGPFGMEATVRSAGAFYSILGFCIMPFVWSLPESLMATELATAYPEAAGGVAWVEEAFGPAAGFMFGYLAWVSGATDSKCFVRPVDNASILLHDVDKHYTIMYV